MFPAGSLRSTLRNGGSKHGDHQQSPDKSWRKEDRQGSERKTADLLLSEQN